MIINPKSISILSELGRNEKTPSLLEVALPSTEASPSLLTDLPPELFSEKITLPEELINQERSPLSDVPFRELTGSFPNEGALGPGDLEFGEIALPNSISPLLDFSFERNDDNGLFADLNPRDLDNTNPDNFINFLPIPAFNIPITLPEINNFVINGIFVDGSLGGSVSSAGDVNGDGFEDFIIGADGASPDERQHDSGQAYVIFGKIDGFSTPFTQLDLNGSNGFVIDGLEEHDNLGTSVSSAGDINGDGFADLIIGAPREFDEPGYSYIIYGKSDPFAPSLDLSSLNGINGFVLKGTEEMDNTGTSVSNAGDINGDGYDDFIIGSYVASAFAGEAYVIFGKMGSFPISFNLSDLNGTNGFTINGLNTSDILGASVSSAGDINGDGYKDLIVSAPLNDLDGGFDNGQIYVIFGKNGGFTSSFDLSGLNGINGFSLNGVKESDEAGWSASSAGDINGDGYDDIIIGADEASPNDLDEAGQAYVIFGKMNGFSASLDLSSLNGTNGFTINGLNEENSLGESVSSAGDINGDGYDDIIIGADEATPPGGPLEAGQAYVIFGKSGGFSALFDLANLEETDGFIINGTDLNGDTGQSVSSAGDINGDGYDDLLVGSDNASPNGQNDAGNTYVIYGGEHLNGQSTHIGTIGNDTLIGTTNADIMNGKQGNDTLNTRGGVDTAYGAQGDDLIILQDNTFMKVDGGSGFDTVAWDNSQEFDLTNIFDNKLEGIERIDLGLNSGSLTVNTLEVLNLSNTSNTLRVDGDGDNTVAFDTGEWSGPVELIDGGQTYDVYTNGAAILQIDADVNVVALALN